MENLGKIGRKIAKGTELGFREIVTILSTLGLYGGNRKTKVPLKPNTRIHTPEGHFGNSRRNIIKRMPSDRTLLSLDASLAILTRVLRFEASRRARIPSPPAEPPVLVLWLNQVTRWFFGEPPQTPRADSGRESLPYTGSCPRLHLAFLATMRPALDPAGHWVPQAEPTCLSTPWRPCKSKTFRARSSPAPTQIKLQPAPTILGQESVHTTLSITHHSQERPSTSPQTLRSSTLQNLPI
jgi:hypothetical protein